MPTRAPEAAAGRRTRSSAGHGRFITFEGGEGAGKSTQVRRLAARLGELGIPVVVTREPGGSPGAEAIRHVLLAGAAKPLGPLAETALFAAARADHLDSTIRPALAQGMWVLSDRFADSTRAYQGASGRVAAELIESLERVTVGATRPDLTLILDLPAEQGLARAAARSGAGADRFESESITFHRTLRDSFLAIAAREPARCVVIDAREPPDHVAEAIWRVVEDRLVPPSGSKPRQRRVSP